MNNQEIKYMNRSDWAVTDESVFAEEAVCYQVRSDLREVGGELHVYTTVDELI